MAWTPGGVHDQRKGSGFSFLIESAPDMWPSPTPGRRSKLRRSGQNKQTTSRATTHDCTALCSRAAGGGRGILNTWLRPQRLVLPQNVQERLAISWRPASPDCAWEASGKHQRRHTACPGAGFPGGWVPTPIPAWRQALRDSLMGYPSAPPSPTRPGTPWDPRRPTDTSVVEPRMIPEHRSLAPRTIALEGHAPTIGREEICDRVPVAIVSLTHGGHRQRAVAA